MNAVTALLVWITLTTAIHSHEETEEDKLERISAELKLADWGLADMYEDITKARKKVLLHLTKYTDEIEAIVTYGGYVQEQSANFLKMPENDIPYEYQRNYTLFTKSGDFLLNKTDLHKLVTFAKENDHLSRNLRIDHPAEPDRKIGKQTFLDLLATSRNLSLLQEVWCKWQNEVSYYFNRFEKTLSLVNEATARNDVYDAKAYWEMLIEYENGYQQSENLWNEIEPVYRKLHTFVLTRINNYYSTNFTEIPVYLTGSNFGEDWSNLAEIIIPHQQMYKDAKFAFDKQSIKDIYDLANACAKKMGFNKPILLSKSNFKYESCEPILLTYSKSKYSEILTCKNLTWNTYLNAHEVVLKAALKDFDYQSLPRRELRQSFLDEAIVSLGSVIAIQNLPNYGFTPECDYNALENATEYGLSARLLVALRILPRLAYYMAADTWRLEELQNTSENITMSWWEIRKRYQGVQGVSNEESDFLADPYIVGNKPYLAKFIGAILQFQLLTYHQLAPFTHNDNLADRLHDEIDFRGAIQDIPMKSPADVLSYNYAISDINAAALTEFFQPLEDYLDNAPLLPYPTITRIRKVEPPPVELTTTPNSDITPVTEIEDPAMQNDQNILNLTRNNTKSNVEPTVVPVTPASGYSPGIYVFVTIGACFVILATVLVFKKLILMKRPRTNNRRFET